MTSAAPRTAAPASPAWWATAAKAAAFSALVAVAAYAALYAPRDLGRVTPIWPANALTVVALLRAAPRRWPLWMAAGFAGNLLADLMVDDSFDRALALSVCNMLEVAICGLAIRRAAPVRFDPGRMLHLAAGCVVAVAASLASASAAAAYLGLVHGRHFGAELTVWTLADALGLVVFVPCLLVLADWRVHVGERQPTWRAVMILAAVIGFEAVVFAQDQYPLLFLAPLPALVASLSLEMLGAMVLVLGTAAVAVGFTFAGYGPIVRFVPGWTERLILLQVFIAACSAVNLEVAAMQRQRRLVAAQLAAALAEAEQAARVKSEFLANMSHEIRTPLTSILGFAALLAERNLGDEAGGYARRVLGASRNLLALVNDVLDFSRLEAGRLELKPGPGDPDECGRDAVELFANQADEKGLALDFEPCGTGRLTADFDRVRQVLMNLVGNAVKFTGRGAVTVSCRYEADRGILAYRVRDTGPGLDGEAQGKLFKRFSQVDAAVNRQHGGSGLGLAISKGLVDAMGGRIGVESEPGEGAVFWFEVPVTPAPAEAASDSATLDLGLFVGLSVLMVDDNAANRELIRSMLTPLGVVVTTADGGEAAIALAELRPFQLVLMDLRMPGVDGWAAARAIRDGAGPNRGAPILAFSADITADDQIASDVFQGVVRKPIEMLELLTTIARWSREAPAPAEAPKRSQRRR
ncbi:MAG: MASE1 domain-containing protein [Caulobacterales bacterium]|nr:MASE1 domain-containing protein [Caulobacterales bacterium]